MRHGGGFARARHRQHPGVEASGVGDDGLLFGGELVHGIHRFIIAWRGNFFRNGERGKPNNPQLKSPTADYQQVGDVACSFLLAVVKGGKIWPDQVTRLHLGRFWQRVWCS